jgi:prepilin-type N-terminal cleavage/methylation domain-containing protein
MTDSSPYEKPARRGGFTLVELMVVAAVIVCLLVVTVPAFKSMINSGQQAQSLNMIRATLLAVRDYALTRSVPAGVRFQDDGRIVPIYAANAGLHDPGNYRQTTGGGQLPGQAGAPFLMHAIEGMAPAILPGAYRVTALDYTYSGAWQCTPNWFQGQQWFLTAAIVFSPRGRAVQAKVQFPVNWAPTMAGAYGHWLNSTWTGLGGSTNNPCVTYAYQGLNIPMTGPAVSYDFRTFDYGSVQPCLATGHTSEAYTEIERSGSDFLVDAATGRIIRKGADMASEQ